MTFSLRPHFPLFTKMTKPNGSVSSQSLLLNASNLSKNIWEVSHSLYSTRMIMYRPKTGTKPWKILRTLEVWVLRPNLNSVKSSKDANHANRTICPQFWILKRKETRLLSSQTLLANKISTNWRLRVICASTGEHLTLLRNNPGSTLHLNSSNPRPRSKTMWKKCKEAISIDWKTLS